MKRGYLIRLKFLWVAVFLAVVTAVALRPSSRPPAYSQAGSLSSYILRTLSAPAAPAHWLRVYGVAGSHGALSVDSVSDGGLLIGGQKEGLGYSDLWLAKTDSSGRIQWQKTASGERLEQIRSAVETRDGGILAVAWARTAASSDNDLWLIKLDAAGRVLWQEAIAGLYPATGPGLVATADGGAILAANTGWDTVLLKLGASGAIEWQSLYGGPEVERVGSIASVPAGGFVVGGCTYSFGTVWPTPWVFKVDAAGAIEWQNRFAGIYLDRERASEEQIEVRPTADGGYLAAFSRWADFTVFKLDAAGRPIWQKSFDGGQKDYAYGAAPAPDGTARIVGSTRSFTPDLENVWLLTLGSNGELQDERVFLGSRYERATAIRILNDGAAVVVGETGSWGPDLRDAFACRVPANGPPCPPYATTAATIRVVQAEAIPTGAAAVPAGFTAVPLALSLVEASFADTLLCGTALFDLKIASGPNGTTNPRPGIHSYAPGVEARIAALPDEHYEFVEWSGDVPAGHETDNPLLLGMTASWSIAARFQRIIYPLLDVAGRRVTVGRRPASAETILLSWRPNPLNVDIVATRIYRMDGEIASLIGDVRAGVTVFLDRDVPFGQAQTYALAAVNSEKREGRRAILIVP